MKISVDPVQAHKQKSVTLRDIFHGVNGSYLLILATFRVALGYTNPIFSQAPDEKNQCIVGT